MHDDCVKPVFEWAQREKRAVFVHCGVLSVGVRKKLGLASPFDMRFSNPIDVHAIASRYPAVPVIVPHFGAGYFREALMLITSSAPPAAWAAMGPTGLNASSQIDTPTRTPPTSTRLGVISPRAK